MTSIMDNFVPKITKRIFLVKFLVTKKITLYSYYKSITKLVLFFSFATKSNNFFNMIILGQIATSTAVLALTMFQLSLVNPLSSEGLNHLFYIAGIVMQILLYCWYGNEVETKVI